jgi:prepilin-type N-terminal cleavage/methylation domain-containing protein
MRTRNERGEAGFTLIEILAVIAILGLLMAIASVGYGKYRQRGNMAATRARIESLQLMIQKYDGKYGGPPYDTLARYKVQTSNAVNEGIEALYVGLHQKDFADGGTIDESLLCNTDEDTTATAYHRIAGFSNQLFEVKDAWGNPIAYFHFSNYGKKQTYRMSPDAAPDTANLDQDVSAKQSSMTGVYVNPDSYQLISAGPDFIFGTDDDVTN